MAETFGKNPEKNLSIGILAHVDAGKTTLSEALLYLSGKIRKLGRVDHKDAYLDTSPLERERGITIFSKQAILDLGDTRVTLLDTPGHVDFSAEMERTLQVLDYAILVINGADGVQGHTVTLWRLLERYQIPDEVIQYIAMNIKTNIRELEGSLNKLIALYRIGGRKNFDVSLAADALKDMIAPDESHKVTPELVLDVVSDHFNVSVSELKGSRRNARTAGARQIVMYLCRQMTDASLQSIGDLLGGRDHSTVNHGVDKIARDVEKDEPLRNTIEIIQKKISPL